MSTATASPVAPPEGAAPLAAVVPLTDCYPSPSNPRKHFHALPELALSITKKGIIQPLVVRARETAQGRLEVVDGERRYRAALQAGLQFVPVIFRDELTDSEVLELQIENALQRADLTPLEEARGFKALLSSNRAKYSPAYIADRISRSERFVVDRMRLLDLLPALQQLLDQERIGVAHAELLAKLTTADQARAMDPSGHRGRTGGLWAGEESTLDFDELNEEPDRARDPYAGLKVVTVKELEAWIARHVRFDVDRMAETAPLEFATVAGQVATAAAKVGRGKKVIHITHDHHLADEVKDPAQRVYGPRSWKRADGTVASVLDGRGKRIDAKTCEASVLGLVTVGPEYGTAFQVCIARDTCKVHWGAEIREKEKREQLRAAGKGDQANKREQKERDRYAEQQKREAAERQAANALYRRIYPTLATAIGDAVPPATAVAALAYVWKRCTHGDKMPKEVTTADALVRALVAQEIGNEAPRGRDDDTYTTHAYALQRLTGLAESFGVDVKPLIATAKSEIATEAKAAARAAPAAGAKAKAAQKTRKAAKRR